jgi:hypothetical protein
VHINPLDVLDAARLHTLALILDTRITNWASAVVVNLAGHVPILDI